MKNKEVMTVAVFLLEFLIGCKLGNGTPLGHFRAISILQLVGSAGPACRDEGDFCSASCRLSCF